MTTKRAERFADSPLSYFTYTGWVVIVTLLVTGWLRHRLGDYGWMFTWQMLIGAGVTLVYVVFAVVRGGRSVDELNSPRVTSSKGNLSKHPLIESFKVWFVAMPGADRFRRVRVNMESFGVWLADVPGGRRLLRWLAFVTSQLQTISVYAPGLIYCLVALALISLDSRRYVIVIAVIETTAVCTLLPKVNIAARFWVFALAMVSWGLTSGLSFTHLSDWLLNGDPSTGLSVIAFLSAFGLVLAELCKNGSAAKSRKAVYVTSFVAVGVFAAFALRTDHFLVDWVPIHRSYFADVAQSVKGGHWLLWDVPSIYGFLSILSLALIPASNAWQALYELTAFFMIAEATIVFAILRWGRAGWSNLLFSIAFPLAMNGDSLTRYAWNGRLYPQGGLRFFWTVDLLMIAFLMFVWRGSRFRVDLLRYAGHFVWFLALLWSLENALWASTVWFGFLAVEALTLRPKLKLNSQLKLLFLHVWPIVALPIFGVSIIELFYRLKLGHAPDWIAYVEFTSLFASGGVRSIFHVQALGAGWSILIVLGAVGALCIGAARVRRFEALPLLAATWLAVWATASYYAVEPLDLYVALLMAVSAPAIAISIFISREVLQGDESALFARLSLAPLAIVAIAFSIGEPSRLAQMQLPFMNGWQFDVTRSIPPISGELADLMTRAKIEPSDRVLFPTGPYWTELDQGLILPFTRTAGGRTVEYQSWLPTSPAGPEEMFNGLSAARRKVYLTRYIAQDRRAGWLITYREPAVCENLLADLQTVRSFSSTNFRASLCAWTGSDVARRRASLQQSARDGVD